MLIYQILTENKGALIIYLEGGGYDDFERGHFFSLL